MIACYSCKIQPSRSQRATVTEIEIVLSETSSVYKSANWALIKAQILSITEKNQLSRPLGYYIKESRIKRTYWST